MARAYGISFFARFYVRCCRLFEVKKKSETPALFKGLVFNERTLHQRNLIIELEEHNKLKKHA